MGLIINMGLIIIMGMSYEIVQLATIMSYSCDIFFGFRLILVEVKVLNPHRITEVNILWFETFFLNLFLFFLKQY